MPVLMTTRAFIEKARVIHGERFDYSRVEYNGVTKPVVIICPTHGEFLQTPTDHFTSTHGCRICGRDAQREKNRKPFAVFLEAARALHGAERYTYSPASYAQAKDKIEILCPEHGKFVQQAQAHLSGCGCPTCGTMARATRKRATASQFIEKANAIHGIGRYDYSQVDYQTSNDKVKIGCFEHGLFLQRPYSHLAGNGCQKCAAISRGKLLAVKYAGRTLNECTTRAGWTAFQNGRKAILYVVELRSESELFYKIGITFDLSKRFHQSKLPYSWHTIALFKSYNAGQVFDLEARLHREFKHLQYRPQAGFGGQTECYSSVADILAALPPNTFFLKNRPIS